MWKSIVLLVALALSGAVFEDDSKSDKPSKPIKPAGIVLSVSESGSVVAVGAGVGGAMEIIGPSEIETGSMVTLEIGGLPSADVTKPLAETLAWVNQLKFVLNSPAESQDKLRGNLSFDVLSQSWRLHISWVPSVDGVYVLGFVNGDGNLLLHRVVAGKGPKPPPGPVDPKPPIPVPNGGLQVLIIEDSAARFKLPKEQVGIFNSVPIKEYLRAKCLKTADGTPDFRIIGHTQDLSKEQQYLRDAFKIWENNPQKTLPWIIVTTGTDGVSQPLPKTIEEKIGRAHV